MAMHSPLYSVSLLVLGLLAMGACGESGSLPEDPDRASPAGPSLAAAASNSWSLKAALPTAACAASAVSVANGAGQSFVYAFGGRRNGEPDWPIEVYNVATDTWVARKTFADGSGMNGVVRIGNRLYYSGGWTTADDRFGNASNHLFAYDFADDRLIQRADLPFHNAEGTSGAIGGKLYVLLGICSGEGWPAPGYCNGPGGLRRLYRYDPATNVWAARASAPHYHAGGGGAGLNGKFYVVAGE